MERFLTLLIGLMDGWKARDSEREAKNKKDREQAMLENKVDSFRPVAPNTKQQYLLLSAFRELICLDYAQGVDAKLRVTG